MVPYGADVLARAEDLVKLAFRQPRPVLIRSLDVIHAGSALAGKAQALFARDTWLREVADVARLKVLPE